MAGKKVALVTGSSSGIGRAIAVAFAKSGYFVVLVGTDAHKCREVYEEINQITNSKNVAVIGDLRKRENAERAISEALLAYNRIDVLVNNAGLFTPARLDDGMDAYEIYQNMIRTNLDTAVLMTILATPHLRETKGCIVNISSNLDRVCLSGSFAYGAAKAGLTMFSKSCAVELAPDVRVNSISPGPVATPMCVKNGQTVESFRKAVGGSCLTGRVGEPDEIARMVLFLCSPESSFITGSDFVIDGGSTIKPAGQIMGEKS